MNTTQPTSAPKIKKGHLAVVLPDGTVAYRRTGNEYSHVVAVRQGETWHAGSWHRSAALAAKSSQSLPYSNRPTQVVPVYVPQAATADLAARIKAAAQSDVAEVIELKVTQRAAAATPPKARRGRKGVEAAAVEAGTPVDDLDPAVRPARPAKERRNETTHPDGASAAASVGCPTCAAKKGARCLRHDGERTNHVHSGRMKAWEAKGSPAATLPASAKAAPKKAAAKAATAGAK